MGQRLVVTIKNGNTALANAYYHWSGYTDSALEITSICINRFKETEYTLPIDIAIDMLQCTGAGFSTEELESFFKVKAANPIMRIEPIDILDRNTGILAVSDSGIKSNQEWSEGDVFIDIASKSVDFGVLLDEDEEWMLEEWYDQNETDREKVPPSEVVAKIREETPVCKYDNNDIPFDEFDDFAEFMYHNSRVIIGGDLICKI